MKQFCNKCKQIKEFHLHKSRSTGLQAYCVDCSLIIRRSYKNNPKKEWARKLKYRYNITEECYFRTLKQQENKCNICKKEETKKTLTGEIQKLSIDHCHTTGKFRGLLCDSCNIGLGKFKDNIEFLKNAIKHLKQTTGEKK